MATGEISATQYCRTGNSTALKEKKMSWDLLFEDKSSFTLVQIQISFLVSWEILARAALKSNRMVINTSRIAWLSWASFEKML